VLLFAVPILIIIFILNSAPHVPLFIITIIDLHTQTDERLWFPLELSDAPSICRVINDVSCFKGGYELVCGIKKKCKTHTRTTLRCQCGNRAKHSVGTKNATESTKPQDDKPICGVYINIFQDIGTGQYYIRKNGGHNLHHSGHPPVQKELKPAKRNKEMMNGDEAVTMNMDEALIKDGDSGKRSLGTHSKHGHNKRSNTTVCNALAMMADRKNQNAYSRIYPNFVEAADACTSEEDIQKLVDLLNEFRFATIGTNSRAVGRHLASQDLC